MEISEFILNKIYNYFQIISLDKHNQILKNVGCPYYQTSIKSIYQYLELIKEREITLENKKFLDVGSGIGIVCGIASYFGLAAEGIELNPILYNVSKQMFPDIMIHNIDIREFNNYQNYDIIFYFYPLANDKLYEELEIKVENNISVGAYVITSNVSKKKDDRFISINNDSIKNEIWLKVRE